VAIQRCAVVMQRGGAAMTQHGSAVVTQLVSAVVMQRGSAGMTPHASAVVTPCGSAVVTQRGSPDATELHTRGESESETRLPRGITTTTARSSDVTKPLQRDVSGFESWQHRCCCGTTPISTMGAVLLKGSGAATKRDPLHDRCIGVTAALRYDTIARGSRIKDWRHDTERYISDSAAMLPSADGIHNMAAIVQLFSTSSPS
jgi:hypothetical protein